VNNELALAHTCTQKTVIKLTFQVYFDWLVVLQMSKEKKELCKLLDWYLLHAFLTLNQNVKAAVVSQ